MQFLFVLLIVMQQTIATSGAHQQKKEKIMDLDAKLNQTKYENVERDKKVHDLIEANKILQEENEELRKENNKTKELEKENDMLLDENINYITKTAKKEYKIMHLRSEIRTMILNFGGMLTVILIINIIAHLLGFGCCRKCKKTTHNAQIDYSLAADDDEDTESISALV